jgi:hypothetical protein
MVRRGLDPVAQEAAEVVSWHRSEAAAQRTAQEVAVEKANVRTFPVE